MKLNSKLISCLLIFLMCFGFTLFNGLNTKAKETTTKTITITKKWLNDEADVRPNDITVHLKKTGSILLPGSVNSNPNTSPLEDKIKQIAGSGSANSDNTNIKEIKYATEEEYNAKKSSLTSSNEIQESGEKTYMWFESSTGTMYFYSEAENIYLNTYSGGIFRKMRALEDISGLSHLNTHYVQDMNRLFQSSTKVKDFTPIADWDVSNVQNFRFAFGSINPQTDQFQIENFDAFQNWDMSSVTDANQMFKGFGAYIDDMGPLANWDLSSLQDAEQMFNYVSNKKTELNNIDVIENWDVRRVTTFSNMFNNLNSNVSSLNLPTFTLRPGSWISAGTYTPSTSALPAAPYTAPGTPVLTQEYTTVANGWVKNGDTWTYEFTVPDDGSVYTVWENALTDYYNSSALVNDPITGVSDDATITNTNTKKKEINITKIWNDSINTSFRPNNIKIHLIKDGSTYDKVSVDNNWVKNGDTWTYKYYVYDDDTYKVYEENVNKYQSTATSTSPQSIINDAATITNTLKAYDITLISQVTGNMAETDFEFEYNIKLYDTDNNIVTGNIVIEKNGTSETVTSTSDGFTVRLKHGENVIIKDVVEGYTYRISVTDTVYEEEYQITDSNGGIITDRTIGLNATGTITSTQIVTFINNKETSVLTGMFTNILPFIIMIIGALAGVIVLNNKLIKQEII